MSRGATRSTSARAASSDAPAWSRPTSFSTPRSGASCASAVPFRNRSAWRGSVPAGITPTTVTGVLVDDDRPPDERRVAAVSSRPQSFADQYGRASRVARILRAEVAPESRAHAEDVKVVRGDDRRLHLLRLGVPRQRVADVGRGHGSHARERRQVRAPGLVLARRELDRLDAFLEIRLPENGEPFRLIDRQRAQQHRLHGRGDRRRRADADAERGRGRNHQGRPLDELAKEAADGW